MANKNSETKKVNKNEKVVEEVVEETQDLVEETQNSTDDSFESTLESEVENKTQNIEVEELKQTVNALLEKIAELQKQQDNLSVSTPLEPIYNPQERDEVVLISNLTGTLRVKFPSWTLAMSRFGQKVSVTNRQFQELVNNHRKYFEREYILVDPKFMKIAEELDVPVYNPDSKSTIHPQDLKRIGKMSGAELEEYYKNLSEPMQRMFINYFMGKCYEYDPDYFTVEKMGLLNTITKSNLFEYLIKLCSSKFASNG